MISENVAQSFYGMTLFLVEMDEIENKIKKSIA